MSEAKKEIAKREKSEKMVAVPPLTALRGLSARRISLNCGTSLNAHARVPAWYCLVAAVVGPRCAW